MAEPITPSAAAAGLSSGIVGAVLVGLGITWPAVIWGVCGCIVGLSWAPATGRLRAFALFGAASLLSAKAGAVGALLWFAGSDNVAGGLAAASGIIFHPSLAVVVNKLPDIITKRFA